MKRLTLFLIALFLTACASIPPQYLAQQPIEVETNQLGEYWEPKEQSFSFYPPSNSESKSMPKGFVEIRYLIDSNGYIFNPEVVKSVPAGVWDKHGLKAVSKVQYKPSENNSELVPVFVTMKFEFDTSS